jgi:hypothetical protein
MPTARQYERQRLTVNAAQPGCRAGLPAGSLNHGWATTSAKCAYMPIQLPPSLPAKSVLATTH